jgi:hypothetical protein
MDNTPPKNEYNKYLNIFFNPELEQTCSECSGSNTNYIKKAISDNEFILECKDKSCYWGRKISLNQYVNIDNQVAKLKKEKKSLLYKINNSILRDDESEFKKIQKRYIDVSKDIDVLDKKYTDNKKELMENIDMIYEFSRKLYKLFYDRKKIYEEINHTLVNSKLKSELIKIYKNEKDNITDKRILEISKNTGLSSTQIKKWFDWFKLSVNYVKDNNKLKEYEQNLQDIKSEFQYNIQNFLNKSYTIDTLKKGKIKITNNIERVGNDNDIKKENKDKKVKKRRKIKVSKIKTSGKKL